MKITTRELVELVNQYDNGAQDADTILALIKCVDRPAARALWELEALGNMSLKHAAWTVDALSAEGWQLVKVEES